MLKIAYHPIYNHPLPDTHRFPMEKYDLIPQQLIHEGTCAKDNFFEPEIPNNKYFFSVHTPEYFFDLLNITLSKKEERKIGFPLSEQLIAREMVITDGSMKASEFALEHGIAMNIAGGTHHAFTNSGEGFCLLNDQAVSARYLQNKGLIKKVLIVDLDVHQGNGTAEIFKDDPSVFTFSMHGKTNYPFHKEQSDLDIPLENNTKDEEYLSILKNTLPKLIKEQQPDFIFYQCGVDILESDKLGKLCISLEGCKERDRFVLQTCYDNKIPVMCSMGGGYSTDINIIVQAHANTFRLAQEIFF
ncbi:acetoin utilization deacetylase AcuC-like enzyme [Tenacibaculum skagerrakense]|uniref:Acetoin utilization deacetylase AcuC-like enzyme n=1 Tax=Tenacibaculum skagerrakense TaxID=186571 RepID=A0A4R2P0X8_9FLAO|nr:histone deacetylase [Tenacibaculum skagerrakense]TCP28309.1 acetoin utilization deacetylase AcuC-like enzyme [Tenacibaculum skagerrakense]